MDSVPDPDLDELEAELGYRFKDRELLHRALTHSSLRSDLNYSNERLEFLGDAILGMTVSERLFGELPDRTEGELTRIKSVVVSRATLARVGRLLRLGEYLLIGKGLGQRKSVPASILANAFEAVLAAVYLDGGINEARGFVDRRLSTDIERVLTNRHELNYKSILQQYAQRVLAATPTYRVKREEGPAHFRNFTIAAVLDGREHGVGSGNSKKDAEQMAAAETLRQLCIDPKTGTKAEEEPEGPPPPDDPPGL